MDLINFDQEATHGTGFGLCLDFAISTVAWTLLFILFYNYPDLSAYKMKYEVYLDFKNRMVSFVHGVSVIFLCAYHIMFTFTECGDPTISIEYFLLVLSGGYFTYDFLAMAWLKLLDKDMTIHHILVIFGALITLEQNSGTGYFVLGLFVSEVSNPAMHIRIMLRNLGKRYTRAYEVAEYTYFISFFIGRVIIGHPVLYVSLMCPALSKFTKFVSLGICA